MRAAQRARRLLKGRYGLSAAVECVTMTAGLCIPVTELLALRLIGWRDAGNIRSAALWNGGWPYALLTVGLLTMDWLLLSPFLLGRAAYYWHLVSGGRPSLGQLFSFFGHRYRQALRWRFSLCLRRLLWNTVCFAPAALTMGMADYLRGRVVGNLLNDVIILLCSILGMLFLLGGWLVCEMLMMRYLPAVLFIVSQPAGERWDKTVFSRAAAAMRGHVTEMFWVYAGFVGWLLSCVFLLPYVYVTPLFFTTRTWTLKSIMEESAAAAVPQAAAPKPAWLGDTVPLPTLVYHDDL